MRHARIAECDGCLGKVQVGTISNDIRKPFFVIYDGFLTYEGDGAKYDESRSPQLVKGMRRGFSDFVSGNEMVCGENSIIDVSVKFARLQKSKPSYFSIEMYMMQKERGEFTQFSTDFCKTIEPLIMSFDSMLGGENITVSKTKNG